MSNTSKYSADTERVSIPAAAAREVIAGIMAHHGCNPDICAVVAEHLIDFD